MNKGRRNFLRSSAFLGTGILASKSVAAQHEQHQQPQAAKKEAPPQKQSPSKIVKPAAPASNVSVITPDIPKLEWTMEDGVKVFTCLRMS